MTTRIQRKKVASIKRIGTPIEKRVALDALQAGDALEYLQDVVEHGCVSGMVAELVYYEDTSAFYKEHQHEIWEVLAEDAKAQGEDGPLAIMAHLQGAKDVRDSQGFENMLAWYSYERAAQTILQGL